MGFKTTTTSSDASAGQGPTPEPLLQGMTPDEPPPGCAPASTPMPWGKHKGTPIGQMPRSYMAWCLENADALKPELRHAFEFMTDQVVGSTEAKIDPDAKPWKKPNGKPHSEQARIAPPPEAQIASLRGLIKSWYRRMSLQYHPDRGGSADQQKVLNACYQSLCEEVSRWQAQ